MLLPRTGEPRAKNTDGHTPSDIARGRGYTELAKVIDGSAATPATQPKTPAQAQGFGTMDIDDPNHPRFQKQ